MDALRSYQEDGKSPFVAQTVIAASYGLMQLMYPTAVERFKYRDVNGVGLPPNKLFEARTSIDLGTEFVSGAFTKRFRSFAQTPEIVDSFEGLLDRFGAALRSYNPDGTYPGRVVGRVRSFPPIAQ